MIIGHHIMYGKVVDLSKPIAVLTRDSSASSPTHLVQAIVKKKLVFKNRPKPIIANVPKKV